MEENLKVSMEKTSKILRRSIYIFLQNYHYFTSMAAFVAFPFSASILISEALIPSFPTSRSLLQTTFSRLNTLFQAAGFPHYSHFFNIFSLKLSQAVISSILTLPFSLTFLLLAKATIIRFLNNLHKQYSPPSFSSAVSIYTPLFKTYIHNSFLLLFVNSSAFVLLFFVFSFLEWFGFSSPELLLFLSGIAAVVYSIVLANSLVLCNFALVLSGMDGSSSGFLTILKAYILIHGKTTMAISLALPVSFGLAGIEALFRCRIARPFYAGERLSSSMALEGMLVAYLYAVFVVLDTVISWVFVKCSKEVSETDDEETDWYLCKIEVSEEKRGNYIHLNGFEVIA